MTDAANSWEIALVANPFTPWPAVGADQSLTVAEMRRAPLDGSMADGPARRTDSNDLLVTADGFEQHRTDADAG